MRAPTSGLIMLWATAAVSAQEGDTPAHSIDWYAGIETSYLSAGGELEFFGTTASVYGGTPTIDMDDGGKVSLSIGFAAPAGWRLEGEFGYLTLRSDDSVVNGLDLREFDSFSMDAEIDSIVLMLNGSYDFDVTNSRFTPFISGGIGVARNRTSQAMLDVELASAIWTGTALEGESIDNYAFPEDEVTEFAWNFSAGLRLRLREQFSLTLEYGVIDLGEAWTGTDANGDALGFSDLINQQWSLGLDYRF